MGVRAVILATIKRLTLATVLPISTGVISCVKKDTYTKLLLELGQCCRRKYIRVDDRFSCKN